MCVCVWGGGGGGGGVKAPGPPAELQKAQTAQEKKMKHSRQCCSFWN